MLHEIQNKVYCMHYSKLAEEIRDNAEAVCKGLNAQALRLREAFYHAHPADQAYVLSYIDYEHSHKLWKELSRKQQRDAFMHLASGRKPMFFRDVRSEQQRTILEHMSADAIADFFDTLERQEREQYMSLLSDDMRSMVYSLLTYASETAGAVMTTNIVMLEYDMTVEEATRKVQQLQPDRTFHRTLYVTDDVGKLLGQVHLEDLVVHAPQERIYDIMQSVLLQAQAREDQEEIARRMRHYDVTNIPVVDEHNVLLGVISANTLVDILEHESSEDIYRMASMQPVHTGYFQTSVARLVYQRSSILVALLLAQSASVMIMQYYEAMIPKFLYFFTTMLASAGGNTSSQTSALVIQGLSSGELTSENKWRFLLREFWIAGAIAGIMAFVGFFRAYFVKGGFFLASLAVSFSLGSIVLASVLLGSFIPFLLHRLNMDPAHYAGPLLATTMDIIGIYIFCSISHVILGS